MKKLPETIGNFRSLIDFDLSNNELATLPTTIGDLPLVEMYNGAKIQKSLNLRFNNDITLPKSIIKVKAVILEDKTLSGSEAYDRNRGVKSPERVVIYKINKYIYVSRRYRFEEGVHVYVKGHSRDINLHTFSNNDDDDTFYKVCEKMKNWVAHNYDIRLIDFKLALVILEQLMVIGAPSACEIFQNELKRVLDGEVPEHALYLIYTRMPSKITYQVSKIKYYEYLDPKDIVNLIDTYQSRVIRNIITSMRTEAYLGEFSLNILDYYPIGENSFLKDFIFTGKEDSKKVHQIIKILEENNARDFKHLLSLGFMEIFTYQDLYALINNPKIRLKQNLLTLIGSGFHPDTRSPYFRIAQKSTTSLICRIKNFTNEWYQDFISLLLTELPKYSPFDTNPLKTLKYYLIEGLITIENITFYRDLATPEELDALDKAIRLKYNHKGKFYYFFKGIIPYEKNHLHSYCLDGTSLGVPSNLELLKDLEYLDLSGCGISTIMDLPELKNLKYLHLQNNKLQDLDGIEKYPNLLELGVGKNKIVNIRAIRHLCKLTTLDLSYNLLEDFKLNPKNFKAVLKMKKLSRLNLANNKSLNYEEIRKEFKKYLIVETPRRGRNHLGFTSYNDI